MEHSPWDSNRLSASQEIPRIFWNPKFHYHVHKCHCHLSLSWTSSIQSTPTHPTSWRHILILSSHLRRHLPRGLFPQVPPPKPCMHISSLPIRTTCPAHFIILDLITWKVFREEYRSLSSSLCSFSTPLPARPSYVNLKLLSGLC